MKLMRFPRTLQTTLTLAQIRVSADRPTLGIVTRPRWPATCLTQKSDPSVFAKENNPMKDAMDLACHESVIGTMNDRLPLEAIS